MDIRTWTSVTDPLTNAPTQREVLVSETRPFLWLMRRSWFKGAQCPDCLGTLKRMSLQKTRCGQIMSQGKVSHGLGVWPVLSGAVTNAELRPGPSKAYPVHSFQTLSALSLSLLHDVRFVTL